MNTKTQGMGTPAIIAIIAIVIVAGSALYFATRPEAEKMMDQGETMMQEGEAMMEEGEKMVNDGEAMMEEGEKMMEDEGAMMQSGEYEGEVLAGGSGGAVLLDFKKADYDKALAEGKTIALYFYANWCPVCKAEFPKMQSAFKELDADVVGFRVNYNDNQTDGDEKKLASEFGVAYQHTKVLIKNGARILKSPEGWDKDRYITEITNAVK